jgi:hypothetical protein
LFLLLVVVAVFGGANDIGGADVQNAGHAVIVDVTPGKGAPAIIAAFPLPLRVTIEAPPFAIPLECFQMVFAFFMTLGQIKKRVSLRVRARRDWMCG